MGSTEISPVQFGSLMAEVASLKQQTTSMQADIRELMALANRSRGGLWTAVTFSSAAGAFIGLVVGHWKP